MSALEMVVASKAMMCALQLMQPADSWYLTPGNMPDIEIRQVTPIEAMATNRGPDAVAMYLPGSSRDYVLHGGRSLIVAPTWDTLVHESCHAIQDVNHLAYSEPQCDAVQAKALTCTYADGVEAAWQRLQQAQVAP